MLAEDLLPSCQSSTTRQKLQQFTKQVETYRRGFALLDSFTDNTSLLIADDKEQTISTALAPVIRMGLGDITVTELREVLETLTSSAKTFGDAHSSFQMLSGIIACDVPATLPASTCLVETLRVIQNAPFDRLHLRQPSFEGDQIKPLLRTAKQEAMELESEEEKLRHHYDLTLGSGLYAPAQLLRYAATVEDSSLWQRLFNGDYKSSRFSAIGISQPTKGKPLVMR